MADWHHLTHKTTGEEQIVMGLGGLDLDEWVAKKLPREPEPHEEVVGGKIKTKHPDKVKAHRGMSTIMHLTLDQLEAIIDERIQQALRAA